jgi:trans-2,3-dihydro-3-hydroxyanthranilate isomerase
MRKIPFYVLDSFTQEAFQGNPAGVFMDDGAALSDEEMRRLAGEISLESAFVLPGEGTAEYTLRYFTGVTEVPFCGHDTVAAATVLARSGRVPLPGSVRFSTNVGVLTVDVEPVGESIGVVLQQNPVELRPPLRVDMVARVASTLGCLIEDVGTENLRLQWASTGTPWLMVPVVSPVVVNNTPTNFNAIAALSRDLDVYGFYVFCLTPEPDEPRGVWSRCYAPIAGLDEDPVTGSGCGALGGYLATHGALTFQPVPDRAHREEAWFRVEQGFAGGRGGIADVQVRRERGVIKGIGVRGIATPVAEGAFTLP